MEIKSENLSREELLNKINEYLKDKINESLKDKNIKMVTPLFQETEEKRAEIVFTLNMIISNETKKRKTQKEDGKPGPYDDIPKDTPNRRYKVNARYIKNKYHNDPEFKEKFKQSMKSISKRYYQRNKEKIKAKVLERTNRIKEEKKILKDKDNLLKTNECIEIQKEDFNVNDQI